MVTLRILFETSHFNPLLQVTPQLHSQVFSRKLMSNLVDNMLIMGAILF